MPSTDLFLSRRRMMQASLAAGAVAVSAPSVRAVPAGPHQPHFLRPAEIRFLTAACDTLIPGDTYPSASAAGVIGYIDLQLATGYGAGERLYLQGPFFKGTGEQGWQADYTPARLIRDGIAAADVAVGRFGDLSPRDRVEMLRTMEAGDLDLGDVPSALFFGELWSLTNEGYFADPAYGGNRNHAGWEMVGFPGAHAYYLDGVDNWNMPYFRAPTGMTHRPVKIIRRRG